MKSNIEHLYEELRKATDGGSESMTHDDALKQIAYWREKCSALQKQPYMPAFPTTEANYTSVKWSDSGMTLRDYFAAKAMQSFLNDVQLITSLGKGLVSPLQICRRAHEFADAMLEARKS